MTKNMPKKVPRILCIRLDNMDDVLLSSPAFRAIKESGAEVTLLTSSDGAKIGRMIPGIDHLITMNAPWVKNGLPVQNTILETAKILKKKRFNAAVIFTSYVQSPLPAALLCYLAGIPLRAAYCRENPQELINWWVPEVEPEDFIRHEVERQLDLVKKLGYTTKNRRLMLAVPESAGRKITAKLKLLNLPDKGWYMLHPGSSAPSRRYPPGSYAEVIRRLYDLKKVAVITGSKADEPVIDKIVSLLPEGSYRKITDLSAEELAALVDRTPFLICNNTGPSHMAAALQTPVIVIYALTNPQQEPWKAVSRILFFDVPCRFCHKNVCPQGHHACVKKILPKEVVDAVFSVTKSQKDRPELPVRYKRRAP